MMNNFSKKIFDFKDFSSFEKSCIEVFNFQASKNSVYNQYIKNINIDISSVKRINDIPFLPIEFFKSHKIITDGAEPEIIFTSSGTGISGISKHFVADKKIYDESFLFSFEYFYGNPSEYVFLALLPSYLERNGSSLIYMTEKLIELGNKEHSGFYLNDFEKLNHKLIELENKNLKTILLGVSFALLDFFEEYKMNLKNTIIIETGGMKGRKEEIVKQELHNFLCKKSGVEVIHSEYGMTELLSQAYSKGNNIFYCPPQMKILIRDTNDPFCFLENGKSGGINVIDLSNLNSCSFIETKDLGLKHNNESFEVLGRFDNSDIRGCNLLI